MDVVEPVEAKELLPEQFRILTVLKGRLAGLPVGGTRLSLLMHAHQEDPGLVVAVHESCCQSRSNRWYEMLAPADGVGVDLLSLVLVCVDRRFARA